MPTLVMRVKLFFQISYLSCPVNYHLFPFHKASCDLRITSFVHDIETIRFLADKTIVPDVFYKKSESRRTQGYDVKVRYLEDNLSAFGENIPGNFSIVGLRINFEGRAKQYVFNYFIPTMMFTVTSWFSYLLPPTSYPARTALLVTIFLCQTGIFTSAIKETPSSDDGKHITFFINFVVCQYFFLGMNSLEEWCFWNFIFSFGSLLSYGFILVRMEIEEMKSNRNNVNPKSEDILGQKRNLMLEATCFLISLGGYFIFIIVYCNQSLFNH